jgi:putative DNA primase/helicase
VTWVLTGNNLSFPSDMATRVLPCYLSPDTERPDQRKFSRADLTEWVRANRARIVAAGLTILRAHALAGRPQPPFKASRFKGWDTVPRAAFVWAGGTDVGAKFDAVYRDDPVRNKVVEMLQAWHAVFGARPVSVSEVIEAGTIGDAFRVDAGARLRSALDDLCGNGGRAGKAGLTPQGVGRRLGKYENRISGGFQLRRMADAHAGASRWYVEPVAPGPSHA